MLLAALDYAARGWPVFPCNMANKQPLLAADRDPKSGAKIRGTGGVSKASTDEAQIRAWWKKWPMAMVGLATGHGRLFVVDFDPRTDEATGEEWTLERLKAELEAQLGGALPATLAVRTPSGGVHLYFVWPDDGGEPIRNRGNLPHHVDVRGLGGYVIAAPSVMENGRQYRWLRGAAETPIADAPAALVEVLRAPKARAPANDVAGQRPAAASSFPPSSGSSPAVHPSGDAGDAAARRYAMAALDAECRTLAAAPLGSRNNQCNTSGFAMGQFVGAGAIAAGVARAALLDAVAGFNDPAKAAVSIDNGLAAGAAEPRDLSAVADAARQRSSWPPPRGSSAPRAPAPPPQSQAENRASFRGGREGGFPDRGQGVEVPPEPLTAVERVRFARLSEAWLERRLEHVEGTKKALTALAWSVGRRVSAGLLDAGDAKEAIWPVCEDVTDVQHADIDRAIEDGAARGFDPGPLRTGLRCAGYPMTDFGLAERFRDRFGADFRFTTAKGWLGWDGRRWKVLDQDKNTPPAELVAAAFETVRAVQHEASAIADTGVKFELVKQGKSDVLAEDDPDAAAMDHWILVGKTWKRFSAMLRAFGRESEKAGKPVAIANLARRWLTVPIEDFDCEQMALNVANGTLRFTVERSGDGTRRAAVRLHPHRREDLITKLASVAHDPEAEAPLYDGMLAWAQPPPEMRRYLHQVGGYALTGHTGEHKLWYNWGQGRNGKSTTIDSWCSALGDYSGTIGVESFMDQGIKKRGDQATPDLAKLGGVRMLRASEAERDSKLNSALIKAVTGGEPMSVRALHRGFFDLLPRFKLLMSGNFKPAIPDTDDGIWGRMKLLSWLRHIEKKDDDPFREKYPESHAAWPKKDQDLLDKIKGVIGPGELSGVLNRLIEGLIDYLENGFVEPQSVTAATQAYRDASDPLARFLRLCTVADPSGRIQSSKLHEVFVAWCKAAGEKEWSNKGLSNALQDKGYKKKASDGMQWLGMRLVRQAGDFVDEHGRVKALPDDMAEEPPNEGEGPLMSGGAGAPPPLPGDDFVPGFDPDPGLPPLD